MLARSICTYLVGHNYFVDHFDNGQDVVDIIETQQHDFYILDINTPLVGGLECLKVISQKYPHIPKIIISAYHDIEYISNAFTFGCSDYLKKPFNLKELEIRVDRLCSGIPVQKVLNEPVILLSEHYIFNKESNLLFYKGEMQQFTKREYALLRLFISNLGQIMTDETIRSFIWNDEDVESSTIRSLVNRVRHKLKEDMIHTIRGFGYIMKRIDSA